MAHTLRRSKSKYGRTRRQRRKQKKMQGGGFFDDFVKKFKPSSPEEKCEKARKDAEEICNSVSQEMPSPPQSDLDSGFPENPTIASESATIAEPEPLESLSDPVIASDSNAMPGSESEVVSPISASAPPPVVQNNEPALALEQPRMPSTMSEPESSMVSTAPAALAAPNAAPSASASPDQKYNGLGGTKRKRKNKKQNRHKKMKSKKHKK